MTQKSCAHTLLGVAPRIRQFHNLRTEFRAQPILNFRARLAWCRLVIHATGHRRSIGYSCDCEIAAWVADRTSGFALAQHRCRSISIPGFVDTHRRSFHGHRCFVACFLTTRGSLDVRAFGNPLRCPGFSRTWSMVHRCLPLWLEAHRVPGEAKVAASASKRVYQANSGELAKTTRYSSSAARFGVVPDADRVAQ